MFRDLWHCCLLISDPVYLMVDSAYSGCCFGGSPVVTGIASSIYCELARPPRGFQNQIYRVGNPRYPIRVRRRKNLSPNPLRFAPAAKLSAHARRRHRRHSTSQPTHITAQYNPRTMPPSPQVCDARDCRHKQHPLSLDYFRKGDSPPECYLYFRRCSDCRRKKYNSFTSAFAQAFPCQGEINTAENVIDYGLCLGFQMKQTSAACFVVSPSPLLC